jgi:hypothetical protein
MIALFPGRIPNFPAVYSTSLWTSRLIVDVVVGYFDLVTLWEAYEQRRAERAA